MNHVLKRAAAAAAAVLVAGLAGCQSCGGKGCWSGFGSSATPQQVEGVPVAGAIPQRPSGTQQTQYLAPGQATGAAVAQTGGMDTGVSVQPAGGVPPVGGGVIPANVSRPTTCTSTTCTDGKCIMVK